ncbi:hypothetical protein SAMN05428957_10953 [Oryzisolibacter propanilivorax]|uniref:Iron uptake protein n=1 Tax=Oryzisolibacter propanilivorax TaxID=1527607 RepID=A0A1G9ULF1_9BURK|nr:iron uptake protein [Oryzisolibacter propanilivorax]SDM60746.1 hypothetical protein SAMN05428957_10953 [Oryzisolibacter propanilivorax]
MTAAATSPRSTRAQVVLRTAAAVLGGYGFCWGFIALALAGLHALDMPFHDAEHLAAMFGLLLYVGVFCWAFFTPGLVRAWCVLAGGGAAMAGAASLLQMALLG